MPEPAEIVAATDTATLAVYRLRMLGDLLSSRGGDGVCLSNEAADALNMTITEAADDVQTLLDLIEEGRA